MNNIHIELARAATISVAAALPLAYLGLHDSSARQMFGAANIAPVKHGTSTPSAAVVDAVDAGALHILSLSDAPRPVTSAEDRWLREAAVRSAKLVARGKLVKIQA
jgi:hypothetical protein